MGVWFSLRHDFNGTMCNCFTRADSLCYEYSVEININFNATKSSCVAFTHNLYRLPLPSLYINNNNNNV